jgi:hypothetical protein
MVQLNTRVRTRSATMMAALMLAPGLAVPVWTAGPAQASAPASALARASALAQLNAANLDLDFDPAEEDRLYVRYLAFYDQREIVRTVARNAVTVRKDLIPAAVARFISTNMDYAIKRARELDARNKDFAERVRATHTVEFAPEVHAAAVYALSKGPVALEAFARTGYAAAMQRDRAFREASGEQAAALDDIDRAFVAHLRDTDPGPNVQAAAGLALRSDADMVEFYAYDWAAAAAVDLQIHQTQAANADAVWRATVRTLLADAKAAHEAALLAVGEAREQARAEAALAWQLLGNQADPAKSTWAAAVEVAEKQAANWQQVALAAAAAADNPNWESITGRAQGNAELWAVEHTTAAGQAAYWTALLDMALAGERDMTS